MAFAGNCRLRPIGDFVILRGQEFLPPDAHTRDIMTLHLLRCLFIFSVLATGACNAAAAQNEPYAGRPGLAEPEMKPRHNTSCSGLSATLKGLGQQPDERIDLWVSGPLTFLHSDGALWYLAICSEPGIRVLCVTYSDNGMKPGEKVLVRGGMRMLDQTHIVLDPCLASRD
jgi:hypothetical protein